MNLSNNSTKFHSTSQKIRMAVCFNGPPGYWRTAVQNARWFFEYRHMHPVYQLPMTVDYFIHTWDMGENIEVGLEEEYKPKAVQQEKLDLDKFPTVRDLVFYSLEKSLLLKREYELTNSIQYDVVISAHLDTVYDPSNKFPLDKVLPKFCYTSNISTCPTELNHLKFDDTIFYGDSATMDLVGDIYSIRRPEIVSMLLDGNQNMCDLNIPSYHSSGCLLYSHLVELGIHPEQKKNIEYAIVGKEAHNEKLSGAHDYVEIRKHWLTSTTNGINK